jgi:hypothetical protein
VGGPSIEEHAIEERRLVNLAIEMAKKYVISCMQNMLYKWEVETRGRQYRAEGHDGLLQHFIFEPVTELQRTVFEEHSMNKTDNS